MKKVKLGELIKVQRGYHFSSKNYVKRSDFALATLANISPNNDFQYNENKLKFYGADFPDRFILKPNDLIMPLTQQTNGLFGNTAFVPETKNFSFVLNTAVGKIIPNNEIVDINFLHFLFSTKWMIKQMEKRSLGTKQSNLYNSVLYDIDVYIPNLETQRKIGKLLHLIEQKIIINNQINDNLVI
ncbi:restriction endonuclease subunit S [Mycoplasma capricolum subsp. capricolum]|uniref:restriction endonuclease subunit S n=1 Tax=Mycoplasma capricolum TaxID=2095 RepID=UPI003DA3A99B